jgi:hypothetical protein
LPHPDGKEDIGTVELVSRLFDSAPSAPSSPRSDPNAQEEANLRKRCCDLARTAGWPSIPIRQGEQIIGSAEGWELFTKRAFAPDVRAVMSALLKSGRGA